MNNKQVLISTYVEYMYITAGTVRTTLSYATNTVDELTSYLVQ